jgi:hypothetical protein
MALLSLFERTLSIFLTINQGFASSGALSPIAKGLDWIRFATAKGR